MDMDAVRRVHDAAVELGAECRSGCPWFNDAQSSEKSYTLERARVLKFLSTTLN
jgi:hypothetical protein